MPIPENNFIYDYVNFVINIIYNLEDNIFVSFLIFDISNFLYEISENLSWFYDLILEFSLSVIPTLITIGFLSWIIKPFIVKEN